MSTTKELAGVVNSFSAKRMQRTSKGRGDPLAFSYAATEIAI